MATETVVTGRGVSIDQESYTDGPIARTERAQFEGMTVSVMEFRNGTIILSLDRLGGTPAALISFHFDKDQAGAIGNMLARTAV